MYMHRPYSTDVMQYVIALFSGYYHVYFHYMSGKNGRFYNDHRNQGILELTPLVYQLLVPSSYQARKV